MGKSFALVAVSVLYLVPLFHGGIAIAASTQDGTEEWGYVEVRPSKPVVLHIHNFLQIFLFTLFDFEAFET